MQVLDISTPQAKADSLAQSLVKELAHHVSLCRQITMAERAILHLKQKISEIEDEHNVTISDENRAEIIRLSREGASIG